MATSLAAAERRSYSTLEARPAGCENAGTVMAIAAYGDPRGGGKPKRPSR